MISLIFLALLSSPSCSSRYGHDPRVLVIIHNPTGWLAKRHSDIVKEPSVWVANNARVVRAMTTRHFSPIELPTRAASPECSSPPEYVVQGALGRRNVASLVQILRSDKLQKRSFIIRHVGSYGLTHEGTIRKTNGIAKSELDSSPHFHFAADEDGFTSETTMRRLLSRAAFMLPLVSPDTSVVPSTYMYFQGKATSSIAYGVHYRHRFVGHAELLDE